MSRAVWLSFITILFLFDCTYCAKRQKRIVGGVPSAVAPEDDPVVFTYKNNKEARVFGTRDSEKKFYMFRGIRYGEPPVGNNRFQRPKMLHLEGDVNATTWGPPCPQPSSNDPENIIGSEDCLFLNIFSPALPDTTEGYPVLIWIHGGSFRTGSACQYEMKNLIKKNTVVVSIQYRLGSLGFLSTGTSTMPGNNGMFDMITAVNWVKYYIEFFGGNPKKIVAFGHGTGAASAIMLSTSKFLKESFSGLIAMSGSILSHFSVDKNPSHAAKYIADKNNCPTNNSVEMVQCLRERPVEDVIRSDSKLITTRMGIKGVISSLAALLGPGPCVEGRDDERTLPNFITDTPENTLKHGDIPSIPLLTGVSNDETSATTNGKHKNEILSKLNTIPNYLTKEFIPTLQTTIPNFENTTKQFVPEAFNNYLSIFTKGDKGSSLKSVAVALQDALFNTPAFLTVDYWSKKAKTFLYSFDHKGKRRYGKDFVAGSPLVDERNSAADQSNHGDDLGYIFDRNSIYGEKIEDENEMIDKVDEEVTDIYTNMIANFARSGDINIQQSSNGISGLSNIPTFSSDSNSFISIKPTPQTMNNFRYCEIGLWTGLANRLQSPTCSLYKTTLEMVDKVGENAQEVIDIAKNPVGTLGGIIDQYVPTTQTATGANLTTSTTQRYDSSYPKFPKTPRIPNLPGLGGLG